MALVEVWRVEHVERRAGPYQDPKGPIALRLWLANRHCDSLNHPNPWKAGEPWAEFGGPAWTPYEVMYGEIFGFLYVDQLENWFHGCLDKLAAFGYLPRLYMVREADIRLGNSQISFKRPTLGG